MSTILLNSKKTQSLRIGSKYHNGVTVFYTKCHHNQILPGKRVKAHNLNQRATENLVITTDIPSGTSNYTQKPPKMQINTKIK